MVVCERYGAERWQEESQGEEIFSFEARNPKFEADVLNPKLKTLNSKQTQMTKAQNSKQKELLFEFQTSDLFRI